MREVSRSRLTWRRAGHEQAVARRVRDRRLDALLTMRLRFLCSRSVDRRGARRTVGMLWLDRKQRARPGALAIVGDRFRPRRRRGMKRTLRVEQRVTNIDAGLLRHVKVRRVILCDGCPDGVAEGGVRPFPRAAIGCDGAEGWVNVRAQICLTTLGELRDLARRRGDVRTRQERRLRQTGSVGHDSGEPARIGPSAGSACASRTASRSLR